MGNLLHNSLWGTAFVLSFTSIVSLFTHSLQSGQIAAEIPEASVESPPHFNDVSPHAIQLLRQRDGLQRSSVASSDAHLFANAELEPDRPSHPSRNGGDQDSSSRLVVRRPYQDSAVDASQKDFNVHQGVGEPMPFASGANFENLKKGTDTVPARRRRRSLAAASADIETAERDQESLILSKTARPSSLASDRRACGEPPLKVYVYELHQKFNFGLFSYKELEKLPFKPEGPLKLHYQRTESGTTRGRGFEHSGEYFLVYNLLVNDTTPRATGSPDVIRVTDPNDADMFFVPFLASLSFNVFTTSGMRGPLAEKDKALQEELFSILKASEWWQRSGGRDHIVPMLQPNALRHIRQRLAPAMFLLLDFGRYAQGTARLTKDVVAPYSHMVPSYEEPETYVAAGGPWEARETLLFFQGTIMRKDEGYIRKLLYDMLHSEPDVKFVENKISGPQDILSAAAGLRRSRFCLNAAGDTPSSARLFDAIVSHCVPVVISNKIELPFESEMDYSEFTVFVSHEDVLRQGYLLRLLRNFPKDRWLLMWQRMQQVKHHFEYQYPSRPGDSVSMIWREIRKKLPRVRLAVNRGKRLVVRDWTNV